MTDQAVSYLFFLVGPLLVKTVAFVLIFQWRKHRVPLITSVILAGAPMLLSIIPIPLPQTVAVLVSFGIALAVLAKYTEVPLVPEGILILVSVEIVSRLVMAGVWSFV
ncbi:MAG TPA: hypothetical protein VNL36_02845 [Bacteroidota bacterium]|nr:hypothetical protein [Bacteroidota bacterium]